MRRFSLHILLILALLGLFTQSSWSQYRPPSTRKNVEGSFEAKDGKAAGTFILKRRELTIEVSGLKAGGVYTVHLVKLKPFQRKGVGVRPHSFTADDSGAAQFAGKLPKKAENWELVLVTHHPTGSPTDTRGSREVLKGTLK